MHEDACRRGRVIVIHVAPKQFSQLPHRKKEMFEVNRMGRFVCCRCRLKHLDPFYPVYKMLTPLKTLDRPPFGIERKMLGGEVELTAHTKTRKEIEFEVDGKVVFVQFPLDAVLSYIKDDVSNVVVNMGQPEDCVHT